jgi:hypothetical protein
MSRYFGHLNLAHRGCAVTVAYHGSGAMEPIFGVRNMSGADHDSASRDRLTEIWVELAIGLGVLGLLLYFSFTLVSVANDPKRSSGTH